jgi:hypothetical protein
MIVTNETSLSHDDLLQDFRIQTFERMSNFNLIRNPKNHFIKKD